MTCPYSVSGLCRHTELWHQSCGNALPQTHYPRHIGLVSEVVVELGPDCPTLLCVQRQEEITERGMAAAEAGRDEVCSASVDLFLEIIGAEAGAMALRGMATGGVYLAGGIMPRLLGRLDSPALRDAFLNHRSRFSRIAKRFPFYALRSEAGLHGVYNYAIALAQQRR